MMILFIKGKIINCSINHSKFSRSWSSKAAPDHHTATTMFDCWHDVLFHQMLCHFYDRCNGLHTFQKVKLLSCQSTEYISKCLGIIKMFLCQQWVSPWNSPMDAIFAQCLSYGWVMNTDLNWGQWGLQFFGCRSGFFCDLLDESLLQ